MTLPGGGHLSLVSQDELQFMQGDWRLDMVGGSRELDQIPPGAVLCISLTVRPGS